MASTEQDAELQTLCTRLQECIATYAGRVEYGNLRSRISNWDCGDGDPVTNIALVYETPGGSTDQINISYYHDSGKFTVIDAEHGEVTIETVEAVLDSIRPRISGIPQKRLETLYAEVRRELDSGTSTAGVVGHLNRMMQSSLLGGTITHLELRDAMTYTVKYMKEKGTTVS